MTAWPPFTRNDRTYVRSPLGSVVTVQPSSVVVGGVICCRDSTGATVLAGVPAVVEGGSVVAGVLPGVGVGGAVVDDPPGSRVGSVTLGSGVGAFRASAAGRCASAPSFGAAVRSTGVSATEASTMLDAVAAHHPAIGLHPENRTRPSSHLLLWCTPWH